MCAKFFLWYKNVSIRSKPEIVHNMIFCFSDLSGTGALFFEFYRILNLVKQEGDGTNFFFLFENVASMDVKHRETISR